MPDTALPARRQATSKSKVVRTNGFEAKRGFLDRRKVLRPYVDFDVPVLDRHEVWLGALVIEETWQPRVLRDWRGSRISLQLAGELLLQPLDQCVEARDAPEHMDVIWRRVQDVARVGRSRRASTRTRTACAIVVGVEEDVSNRADCVTRSGAAARGDRVHADEDVVLPGHSSPAATVETVRSGPRTRSDTLGHAAPLVRLQEYGDPVRRLE